MKTMIILGFAVTILILLLSGWRILKERWAKDFILLHLSGNLSGWVRGEDLRSWLKAGSINLSREAFYRMMERLKKEGKVAHTIEESPMATGIIKKSSLYRSA